MDWKNFLTEQHIPYVEHGPSVTRDHIACHCPWCGIDDPSEHLSISLIGQGFRCWRQPLHSGKNPAKLIQALLGCSWDQAQSLAGNAKTLPNDFLSKMKASLSTKEKEERSSRMLVLPPEFKEFSKKPSCRMYAEYLRQRRFNDKNIFEDTKDYGIYYATQGNYKARILFTITYNDKLVGWTGRTISPNQMVRYDTLTHDFEKASERGEVPAPNPISHYLLFHDRIINSGLDTIVLVEGPFDAFRVNILGEPIGVVSTCFFTSTISDEQINLLHDLLPRFRRKIILLDQNTFSKSARMKSDLTALGVEIKRLPETIEDPGDLVSTRDLKNVLAIV